MQIVSRWIWDRWGWENLETNCGGKTLAAFPACRGRAPVNLLRDHCQWQARKWEERAIFLICSFFFHFLYIWLHCVPFRFARLCSTSFCSVLFYFLVVHFFPCSFVLFFCLLSFHTSVLSNHFASFLNVLSSFFWDLLFCFHLICFVPFYFAPFPLVAQGNSLSSISIWHQETNKTKWTH